MKRHKDSHLDHGLTPDVVDYLLARFKTRDAFFIETVEIPAELGTVPCGLYGPLMGDAPIGDDEVYFARRGDRDYDSRLVDRYPRPSTKVTVIAGPHDGEACVLYTAFGGPLAPKETIELERELAVSKVVRFGIRDEIAASRKFWGEHALAQPKVKS